MDRRIVVVRALPGLGDFLCATPALRALRQLWPDAQVSLVGLSSTRRLVQLYNHLVDELIPFPGFPGIVEKAPNTRALPAFLSEIQSREFDLAMQMHGDGSITNIFTLLLGAQRTLGFYLPPDGDRFAGDFAPYPEELHEIYRNLALVEVAKSQGQVSKFAREQGPEWDESIDFPLTSEDEEAYAQLAKDHGLRTREYACLHAGGSDPTHRWSPESFAAVGRWLREQGFQIVLTGTSGEAETTTRLAARLGTPVTDLTGQTELGALALLLHRARLLVCNDTGVSHLAAAMETPSVVVFVNSDRRRWAPLNHALHRAVGTGDRAPVSVDRVLEAVRGGLTVDGGRSTGVSVPNPNVEESYEFS